MKVAFLTTDVGTFDGWGRYSREIIKQLPRFGIDPVVLVEKGRNSSPLPDIPVHDVLHEHTAVMRNPLLSVRDMAAARRHVFGCDFVHCLAEPHLVTARLLAGRSRTLLTTAVGTYAASVLDTRGSFFYRYAYKSARSIPAISRYSGARLIEKLPGLASKVRAIPLGVESPQPAPVPPAREREAAFLSVGAVKRRKGATYTVQALAGIAPRFPGVKLYMVGDLGDTGYVDEVKRVAESSGVADRVVWLGKISESELESYYRRVRGMVMPSLNNGKHFEGFGLVHLEANARGVPSIGSLGCGNEDAVADEQSGFLVPQGNVERLSEAMSRLLRDDGYWDGISKQALTFAASMSWAKTAGSYAELYRELGKN